MQDQIRLWINDLWIAVAAIWLVTALFSKKTQKAEPWLSRFTYIIITMVGVWLVFLPWTGFGVLGQRFVPDTLLVAQAGLVLVILGVLLAIWARLQLGGNWSGTVTIKQGHELIRRGPYAVVRHPIYTGFLLGLAGTALAGGYIHGLLGLFFALAGFWHKSRIEERFLIEQFGEAYVAYRKQVRALIPFIL
jgi:protein-S-isoprenylcysteine O-methyltransferase Ste14